MFTNKKCFLSIVGKGLHKKGMNLNKEGKYFSISFVLVKGYQLPFTHFSILSHTFNNNIFSILRQYRRQDSSKPFMFLQRFFTTKMGSNLEIMTSTGLLRIRPAVFIQKVHSHVRVCSRTRSIIANKIIGR